jgi:CDP-glycerol glycerophosphotransferase (TagB/SpsB family)
MNDEDIDQDIYTIINNFDLLITDYSSIYIDFLLTKRPIIFAPFDLEEYTRNDRELYFNYNDVTPGPKCQNWDEVLVELKKFISGEDDYKEERQIVNDRFKTFQDGNASERIVEYIQKYLK